MNIVMNIKSRGIFELTHLLKIKEIKAPVASLHLTIDKYIPIILYHGRYCLLTKAYDSSVVFASYDSIDRLLERIKMYIEYELEYPMSYDRTTGIAVIGSKYEVNLI